MTDFKELGTDPWDLNDLLSPCLAAGIGGYIVPESVEIVEICQDSDDLAIVYMRVSVQGVFSYWPELKATFLNQNGIETTVDLSSEIILSYKGSSEAPDSLPFSTACGSKTLLLAWKVGTSIPNYATVSEIKFKLKLYGNFESEEFDQDLLDATNIFESANPSTERVLTKGINPVPYALYFDDSTGQLKLQFSNLGNVSCSCNINCVDISLENQTLVPCDNEIQEVSFDSNYLIEEPTNVDITIEDSIGNSSTSTYHLVVGTKPIPPAVKYKSSIKGIVVTPFFQSSTGVKYDKSKIQYQIWRIENESPKLLVDWTTKKFDSYIDNKVQPGETYSYCVRVKGDFESVSEFSTRSSSISIPSTVKRNIIFFLLDDVGADMLQAYSDQTPFENKTVAEYPGEGIFPYTPNITRIANNGIRFTNARSMPVCSPTRANIYGGQYPFRNGIGTVVSESKSSAGASEWGIDGYDGSPRTQYPIGSLIQEAGNTSFMVGKWHLAIPTGENTYGDTLSPGTPEIASGDPGSGPIHIITHGGWNEVITTFRNLNQFPYSAGNSYYYPQYTLDDSMTGNDQVSFYEFDLDYDYSTEEQKKQVYDTCVQMDHLIEWIENRGTGESFFAMVPLNTIHSPYIPFPPETVVNSTEAIENKDVSAYFNIIAKLEVFDRKLGDVLDQIDNRILDNTNIIIMGDNGSPNQYWDYAALSPANRDIGEIYTSLLTGTQRFKSSVYEPGIKIPLLIAGPDVNTIGRDFRYCVDAVDLYPTILDMVGLDYTEHVSTGYHVDGISFISALHDGTGAAPTRDWSFSEVFDNNGNPDTDAVVRRDRAYVKILTGNDMSSNPYTVSGEFKLVRLGAVGSSDTDELYLLRDENGVDVDPYELNSLPRGSGDLYYQQYLTLQAELVNLLQS